MTRRFKSRVLYALSLVGFFAAARYGFHKMITETYLWSFATVMVFGLAFTIDAWDRQESEAAADLVTLKEKMKASITTVMDFPKPGILFRDITPLLGNSDLFQSAVWMLVKPHLYQIDSVAGIESRGFIFAAAASHAGKFGLHVLRKPGKLPPPVLQHDYDLEYGSDALQIKPGLIKRGSHVLLIDDVIATGGTALAAVDLLKKAGAGKVSAAFLIDLPALGGAQKLRDAGIEVTSVLSF
jgi:adenine phosphoribosyltransferase